MTQNRWGEPQSNYNNIVTSWTPKKGEKIITEEKEIVVITSNRVHHPRFIMVFGPNSSNSPFICNVNSFHYFNIHFNETHR